MLRRWSLFLACSKKIEKVLNIWISSNSLCVRVMFWKKLWILYQNLLNLLYVLLYNIYNNFICLLLMSWYDSKYPRKYKFPCPIAFVKHQNLQQRMTFCKILCFKCKQEVLEGCWYVKCIIWLEGMEFSPLPQIFNLYHHGICFPSWKLNYKGMTNFFLNQH